MEELTIEEKALAYDKAIETAKHYHSEMGDDVKCVLEECFSELRESDDEQIREQIIYYFMAKKISEPQPVLDFWIAWLKKQGNQKSADIQSIEKRAYEVFPDDDDENTLLYRQAFIDGAVDYIDCGCKNIACSEEDERRINHIIAFMSDKERIKDTETMFPIEEDIIWLKSLRPRYHWKPSEEQMKALRKASKNEYLTAGQYDILVSLYDDLKKLREE